jgi:hypothetical protein
MENVEATLMLSVAWMKTGPIMPVRGRALFLWMVGLLQNGTRQATRLSLTYPDERNQDHAQDIFWQLLFEVIGIKPLFPVYKDAEVFGKQ